MQQSRDPESAELINVACNRLLSCIVDKKLMLQYESWRKSAAQHKAERKRKTAQQRAGQEKEELRKRQEECAQAILKEVNLLKCLGDTIQVAQGGEQTRDS